MAVAQSTIHPGVVIQGAYRLSRLINRGAQASVYEAEELHNGRSVALKLIASGDPGFEKGATLLGHEYKILRELEGLEMFLRPYACHADEEYAFIAMELIEGVEDGEEFIRRNSPVNMDSWLWLAKRLTTALHECHKRKIIHRDIKPRNILFASDGGIKIIDFGIAQQGRYVDVNNGAHNMGSIFYIPPEQITEGEFGTAGEMYSLGVTLYQFIAGRVPFHAADPGTIMDKKMRGEFIRPSRVNPDAPKWIDGLFEQLLQPSPRERIQGAKELLTYLSTQSSAYGSDEVVGFETCKACGEELWKELVYCTHCGATYDLRVEAGPWGVIAKTVSDPDNLIQAIDKLTNDGLPKWRREMFKSAYPRTLIAGVSEPSATAIAGLFTNGNSVMLASSSPYRYIFRNARFSLFHCVLIALTLAAIFSGLWDRYFEKNPTIWSILGPVLLLGLLVVHALMPLASKTSFRNMRRNRDWRYLSRFQKTLTSLSSRQVRKKASALVRRSVMLFDKINGAKLSGPVKRELAGSLGKLSVAALGYLEQTDRQSAVLRKHRGTGVAKNLASLEQSLQATTDPGTVESIVNRIAELTTMRSTLEALEQKCRSNEIAYSQILSEINSLHIIAQANDVDRLRADLMQAEVTG